MMLTCLMATMVLMLHIIALREQIIALTVKAEQEDRMCAGLIHVGIVLLKKGLIDPAREEEVISVTIPECIGREYGGKLRFAGNPVATITAQLLYRNSLCRSVKAVISLNSVDKSAHILDWILMPITT